MSVEIRVEGVEEARRALEAVIRQTRGSVAGSLETIGQVWETEVKRFAPVKTGRLRRSYTHEVGTGPGGSYVELSSNVRYAPYQEFGTRFTVGTPHVRPGTEAVIPQVPEIIAGGVTRGRGSLGLGSGRIGGLINRLGALGG